LKIIGHLRQASLWRCKGEEKKRIREGASRKMYLRALFINYPRADKKMGGVKSCGVIFITCNGKKRWVLVSCKDLIGEWIRGGKPQGSNRGGLGGRDR